MTERERGTGGRRVLAESRWRTSDRVLVCMGLFAGTFITAMSVIFCIKGAVPDTLIQCTLGAGGAEALLLAGIKVSKVLAGGKGAGEEEE